MAKKFGILFEKTQKVQSAQTEEENPYWAMEEIPPHPDPSQGCLRRGYCCQSSPGRFAPGEVERAAEGLKMTPDAFVKTYLIIDTIFSEKGNVEVFAPVKIGVDGHPLSPPGRRVPKLYRLLRSPCIFYNAQEGCTIYPYRPLECRRYFCGQDESLNLSSEELAELWRNMKAPQDL